MVSFIPVFLSVLLLVAPTAEAIVPISKTFHFLVEGSYDGVIVEADNLYYTDLPIKTHPFALCIYGLESAFQSNTPGLTLALRLDSRLVWQANRGKSFSRNSTIAFGRDGNLILTNAMGQIIWQTNTRNKGVVDLKLLPNGNMVLVNTKGDIVWQSFDYPTDTILVGQSLLPGYQKKLISRISPFDNRNGPYSLVMDGGKMIFYYKGKYKYSLMKSIALSIENNTYAKMTLQSGQVNQEPYLFEIKFNFTSTDSSTYSVVPTGLELKYNATYSFLQLGQDGNIRIYTYFDKIQLAFMRSPWEETYTMFSRKQYFESECQLPERCGKLGLCEDNQCVACPTPKGLLGWSKACAPPKLPSCNSQFGLKNVDYFKIVGVDHFSSSFSGYGPVKLDDCRRKCTKDCQCLGFFYKMDTSRCLVTSQLNTLTKVSSSSHLAFIKIFK
ncbi:hypothetical protein ACHQM5_003950 [Ranunculus cassubicifolius]